LRLVRHSITAHSANEIVSQRADEGPFFLSFQDTLAQRQVSRLTGIIETYTNTSMRFKRNQVEEAISRTVGERFAEPSPTLRARLKRLLDVDRNLKVGKAGSSKSARAPFAFYSKEPGGKGSEISFSIADACALLVGIRMLEHGWPQTFVVSGLRLIRPDLSRRHEDILNRLIRQRQSEPPPVGTVDFAHPDSDFLLVVSDGLSSNKASASPYLRLFDNQIQAFAFQMERVGRSCSWFPLEGQARMLHEHLLHSLPRRRGRGS
jgi:hypothetical protein